MEIKHLAAALRFPWSCNALETVWWVRKGFGLRQPIALGQATLMMTSPEKKATADEFLHLGRCLQHSLRLATEGSVSGPFHGSPCGPVPSC